MSATKSVDPINALDLLGTYNQDAKTRNNKYNKRIEDGRRGLAKRLCYAIQEITKRGQYMIRFENFYKVRTISYEESHYVVNILDKNDDYVNIETLEYGEMIRLADKLTLGEYTIMAYEQEDFYKEYITTVFPVEDSALSIAEKEVNTIRKQFDESLYELLSNLRKLGLCLKFNPIWSNGSNYVVVSGSGSNNISFYTESRNSGYPNPQLISELRKQIRIKEVRVMPFDQAFK